MRALCLPDFKRRLPPQRPSFSLFRPSVIAPVIVAVLIERLVDAVQDDAEQSLARQRFEQTVEQTVARVTGANDDQRRIGPVDQNRRVGEDAERRSVDHDVIEHAPHFGENAAEARPRKHLGDIVALAPAGQKVETSRLQSHDRCIEFRFASQNLRQPGPTVQSQIAERTWPPQIAVDQKRADAICLGQQPSEIDRGNGLALEHARARDHDRLHLTLLAGMQHMRAQRTELFAFGRLRLRDGDQMLISARGGDIKCREARHTR